MTIDDARFIIENADEALANTYHMDFVEQYGDPEWDNRQAEMRRTINERVAEAEAVLAEANRIGVAWTTYGNKIHARPVGIGKAEALCGQVVFGSLNVNGTPADYVTCKKCRKEMQ